MKEEIILKYLNRSASPAEEREVENWILSSDTNTKKFNALKAQYIASSFETSSNEDLLDKKFHGTLNKVHQSEAKRFQRRSLVLKFAAVVTLIFGIAYSYRSNFVDQESPAPDITHKDAIILQFDNGINKVIDEKVTKQVFDEQGNLVGTHSGMQLVYNKNFGREKLVYNTLKVPYGRRYNILLSDGTAILLNAGTSLKFPINFVKGKNREVYITGEAFFDVAKDTIHPFIVHTDDFDVRVLGTRFSITSYPEDIDANTVLVEGSVSMYAPDSSSGSQSSALLTPGHRAAWSRISKNISIQEVDTTLYTSWTDGRIIFRHLPFKHIIKKLERHYNVSITNNDKELDNKLFTASFDIETIEQVFESFKKYYDVNYKIDNNKITIDP